MEENVTTIVKGEKKYFQKISINMIQCILDFTNYKDYTNYVFTNPRFVKALQTIISRKSDTKQKSKNLKKIVLNKAISVFFNYNLFCAFFKTIYPYLLSIDGFRILISQNCSELVLFCNNIKNDLPKGCDPFEQILECIAIYFNKFLDIHNIDKLNLSKLSMGKNGCYVIAHLIDLNRTLEEIDLSSNDLMYDEIYMLFSKYKQNKHHLSINLLKNNLDAECLKYISNIVKDDLYKTITVNKISRNLSKAVNCWSIVQK
jgi:hypothetical protein